MESYAMESDAMESDAMESDGRPAVNLRRQRRVYNSAGNRLRKLVDIRNPMVFVPIARANYN
jgi:hypothetical protein